MDKYKKKMGLLITKKNGEFYICYNYEVFQINETGARIIELCDGKNSKEDIVEKISTKFNIDKQIVQNDVDVYIDLLINSELIFHVN